jgi:hypothetical protein
LTKMTGTALSTDEALLRIVMNVRDTTRTL